MSESGTPSSVRQQSNDAVFLRQSQRNPSISKKLLESEVLRSSTLHHSVIENEVFSPVEVDANENAILRVSVHQEDNMDISIVRASTYAKNDTPITSLEEEETTDVETVEEDARNYAPLILVKSLPPYECLVYPTNTPLLPPMNPKKQLTLVLDLDETLVHCSMEPIQDYNYDFNIVFQGQRMPVYARIRPYAQKLLEYCSSFCEVVIFTASVPEYANVIVDLLDEKKQFVSHRLYRDACTYVNGLYVKDLSRLGRDLNRTVIVDNSIVCFGYHLNNGIPITSWYDDWNDRELYTLANLIRNLVMLQDIPEFLKRQFKLEYIMEACEVYVFCVY